MFPKPTNELADLSLFEKSLNVANHSDPFGLKNYSYFEFCQIDEQVLEKIEYEVNSKVFANISMIEEISSYWLIYIANNISDPIIKHKLYKLSAEEYEHFLLFTNVLINSFPDVDAEELISEMRDVNFKYANSDKPISDLIMTHFIGECTVPSELKHLYKETTNDFLRGTLKTVLAQEADHMILARNLKVLLGDISNRQKVIISMLAQIVVKYGFGFSYCYAYLSTLDKYNIKYDDLSSSIKKSQRSKQVVCSTIDSLFHLAKLLNLADDNFESFLVDCKIEDKYKEYI
jgi:rubrerythrin